MRSLALGLLFALACRSGSAAEAPGGGGASHAGPRPGEPTPARVAPDAGPPAVAEPGWQVLARGPLATLEVARALYVRGADPELYVRLRIHDLGGGPIGVAIDDPRALVYPNSWGALDTPARQEIDEVRAEPLPLDAGREAALLAAFARTPSPLLAIAGGADAELYVPSNDGHGRAGLAAATRYAYVSLAGQIFVTDGTRGDVLATADVPGPTSDLIVPAPIAWLEVPAGGRVIAR